MTATIHDLHMLEYLRTTFQRHRIQMGNRLGAVERGESDQPVETITRYFERFQEMEDQARVEIASAIQDHEMWPWLKAVKGIGPGLAGCIIAPVDIERASSVSALWRYSGMGVNADGAADRRVKGEKLAYNDSLKRTMYLVGSSFMRGNSPYRAEYDEAKAEYERTRPEWTPKHRDMAARRKMVKLFLSHLWTMWRHERGLPLRPLYVVQHLNHDGIKPPWRYVEYDYPHAVRMHYEEMMGLPMAA